MSCTRSKIVSLAQSWVGLKESDGSHKKIIDIYNTQEKLPRNYRMEYDQPWCACTASALAVACNAADIIPTEVSCGNLIELAKAKGIWVENDAYVPAPGDFMLYDWQDTGKGDNTGWPDHIGIVEAVVGKDITIIEGNYKDAVGRRSKEVDGLYIRGYITPHYDAEQVSKPVHNCIVELPLLSRGSKGAVVKAVQILLLGYAISCGKSGADGSFGPATQAALEWFQKKAGITVTGKCDEETWKKLLSL